MTHDLMKSAEANDAAWEAAKGASIGAIKWGIGAAIVGAAGYYWSPIYRGTTIQFKVYIQMSGMVLGGMLEADWRLREYEHRMRLHRKIQTDRARWARYEEEYLKGNTK